MINFDSTKRDERKNEKKLNNIDYINIKDENNEKKINKILKNLNNEDRELSFPLLDFYFLNKNFKYQNLKESLQIKKNFNEYINLRLLEKEVYPKDSFFQTEQKSRENIVYSKLIIKNQHYRKNNCYTDFDFLLKKKKYDEDEENIISHEDIPSFWKNDIVIRTFNPVYNARENIIKDQDVKSIPTIDVFYNSSKLLSIQTIFEPISNYIFLLRLLPKFCLPLYDSGILQYVCEDSLLNPKLKGLELSYRLLVHDILFYAFFSYLADLPFWAKPPIELLRIYNYESLYSFNDWESEHTERLVFHNIKNILYNFSDTLNQIELLYPKNYYITIFPNIYFKNIIDFLKGENFKLKKIVIEIKGKNHIDSKMINNIKMNLENFRGITTENVKKDIYNKLTINKSNREIKNTKKIIDAIKKCYGSNENFFVDKDKCFSSNNEYKEIMNGKNYNKKNSEKSQICQQKDELSITNMVKNNLSEKEENTEENYKIKKSQEFQTNFDCEEEKNKRLFQEDVTILNNFDDSINEVHINLNKLNNDMHKINTEYNENCEKNKVTFNKISTNNGKIKKDNSYCKDFSCSYKETNEHYNNNLECNNFEKDTYDHNNFKYVNSISDASHKLKNIDISDNYNIDNAIYNFYYNNNNYQKECASIYEGKEKSTNNNKYSSSESSYTEDDSDDENIDGFFKSKKLKSTVYDKSDFSFSKFINSFINYEKIIDYLHNDPQRQENENSKIKFYIKLLLFEKSYSDHIINENRSVNEMRDTSFMDINERDDANNNDESTFISSNLISNQNNNDIQNEISKNNEEKEEMEECVDHGNNHKQLSSENNNSIDINREENILNNNVSNNIQNSSDYISNLIRNLRLTYENNNFLSFDRKEENDEENNFNLDNVQDSVTRITFNFN
ncbi:conserved Plasmodium protein, unknown function [Plasmodium gallinaceum]|uniref:Uncharacterized protein n=1 Tax=Plasmodium gallinaceum TaxID=5849 RepID=A0A1J1H331_PLAGA|nr:conserved Plasmodium protein, unknown function [Plasmodium gallinaceum]CRG97742.1 conserved Plasmodium protein, unknown function [Plasmodium gallinaceum]